MLGLHGLAGSPWKSDMDLTDPGYMGRAVCDQRVGAVSGSALLVRTSLFAEVGGFDADAFPVFDGALDLCLRVSELGKDVVDAVFNDRPLRRRQVDARATDRP